MPASARSPIRPSSSSASATPAVPARRSSPASRAHARCSWKSRRSSPRRASAPRAGRSSAGIGSRLAMVLAVLEARCGMRFGQHDVYLNVAGGLKLGEPAADLAVAAALDFLARQCRPVPEAGLFRRDQPVRGAAAGAADRDAAAVRRKGSALPPPQCRRGAVEPPCSTLSLHPARTLADIVAEIAEFGGRRRRGGRPGECAERSARAGFGELTECLSRCSTGF